MRKLDLSRVSAERFGGGARLRIVAKSGESFLVELTSDKATTLAGELRDALAAPEPDAAEGDGTVAPTKLRSRKTPEAGGSPAESE